MAVMRVMNASLNPSAECDDCLWAVGSDPVSRGEAKSHAKNTGHTVRVTTTTVDIYKETGA